MAQLRDEVGSGGQPALVERLHPARDGDEGGDAGVVDRLPVEGTLEERAINVRSEGMLSLLPVPQGRRRESCRSSRGSPLQTIERGAQSAGGS